jgi:hypothetical protein
LCLEKKTKNKKQTNNSNMAEGQGNKLEFGIGVAFVNVKQPQTNLKGEVFVTVPRLDCITRVLVTERMGLAGPGVSYSVYGVVLNRETGEHSIYKSDLTRIACNAWEWKPSNPEQVAFAGSTQMFVSPRVIRNDPEGTATADKLQSCIDVLVEGPRLARETRFMFLRQVNDVNSFTSHIHGFEIYHKDSEEGKRVDAENIEIILSSEVRGIPSVLTAP